MWNTLFPQSSPDVSVSVMYKVREWWCFWNRCCSYSWTAGAAYCSKVEWGVSVSDVQSQWTIMFLESLLQLLPDGWGGGSQRGGVRCLCRDPERKLWASTSASMILVASMTAHHFAQRLWAVWLTTVCCCLGRISGGGRDSLVFINNFDYKFWVTDRSMIPSESMHKQLLTTNSE